VNLLSGLGIPLIGECKTITEETREDIRGSID